MCCFIFLEGRLQAKLLKVRLLFQRWKTAAAALHCFQSTASDDAYLLYILQLFC